MTGYVYLAIAIVAEVVGTSALKGTEGFSKLGPSVVVVGAYGLAFYMLSLTLRTIPVGVAYALWCGIGMALITLIGWLVLKQIPSVMNHQQKSSSKEPLLGEMELAS